MKGKPDYVVFNQKLSLFMSNSPRFSVSDRPAQLQQALNEVGSWMLSTVSTTGWNELVLEAKPVGDSFFVRFTESYDERDVTGTSRLLDEGEFATEQLSRLQHASYDEAEGAWLSVTVVVAAKNWPTPEYQVGAAYNRTHEPQNWDGEGGFSARDVREHLEKFPRTDALPAWADAKINRGRSLNVADITDEESPNPYLVDALVQFSEERSERALVNVMRQLMGGDILLDATDSDFVADGENPFGPETTVKYTFATLEGYRGLCLFSSPKTVLKSHQEQGRVGEPVMVRENSVKVMMDFLNNQEIDLLVIDPGSPTMSVLERPQVQWVLGTPHNPAAKMALMGQNMQQLLSALAAPSTFLLLGTPAGSIDRQPLIIDGEAEEGRTLLTFTSAAEVSSLDPTLEVTSATSMDVLRFAVDAGVDSVRINGLNPYATLPIAQVKELVELVDAASLGIK